jgi:hypothetical protein
MESGKHEGWQAELVLRSGKRSRTDENGTAVNLEYDREWSDTQVTHVPARPLRHGGEGGSQTL